MFKHGDLPLGSYVSFYELKKVGKGGAHEIFLKIFFLFTYYISYLFTSLSIFKYWNLKLVSDGQSKRVGVRVRG